MKQYHDYLQHILANGVDKGDRTGTGTRSIFGYQMRFDLSKGFPLLTTKKVHFPSILHELIWFLRGDTNIKYLNDNGVTIWDEWADENGDLGPVYGKQWRSWPNTVIEPDPEGRHAGYQVDKPIDQIKWVIDEIKRNPNSRRLIVSAWNPAEVDQMALPPCHLLFQFYVAEGKLSCQLYQRSADSFLGVPFNIASYALLVEIIARLTGLKPGEFIHTIGDGHIYNNHMVQVKQLLSREPKKLPRIGFSKRPFTIDDIAADDIVLIDYESHPGIKAPVAV